MDEIATRRGHTSHLKDTRYNSTLHYDLYHIVTYNYHTDVTYMYPLPPHNGHTTISYASVRVTTSYTAT